MGASQQHRQQGAFEQDSSYCLLCSLEVLDEDRNLERKADMFSKRTINQEKRIDHVDTPVEALAVSIGERAGVDLSFMAEILDLSLIHIYWNRSDRRKKALPNSRMCPIMKMNNLIL